MTTEKPFDMRMYFFVPYNISDKQKTIQAGHALGRYALKFGRYNPKHIVWDFLENHETWIVLDGGTTNSTWDEEGIPLGTLDQIRENLRDNKIDYSWFIEPDLNNALSAVCFIVDERVWNYKDYPSFVEYFINNINEYVTPERKMLIRNIPIEEFESRNKVQYDKWVEIMGGEKNVFLRELIKDKKLA